MKEITIVLISVLFSHILSAQNPLVYQWDKRFGGVSYEYLYAFQQTDDGGYVLGGYSDSYIVSGDKSQPNWSSYSDYWVVKINSVGSKQWDKRFGGFDMDCLRSMEQTYDGGYILGGYSNSDSTGDKTQTAWNSSLDYWIVKIDSLGNKQWDKRYGGTNQDDLKALQQTTDGGYILGGISYSDSSGDKTQNSRDTSLTFTSRGDYWIVKTDSLGNKQWDQRFGGSLMDILYSLQQTSDGGYILGGISYSDSSGDKSQNNRDTSSSVIGWRGDYWIVKTDSLGNRQWDKRYGGSFIEYLYCVKQTNTGQYLLGGISRSGITGDKTQPLWGGNADIDLWIIKTDSAGNILWDKDYGGTSPDEDFGNISLTSDDGYLFAGTSYSPISGNKSENNLGIEQTWIFKTDTSGTVVWDKTIFTMGHDENGFAIQTSDGCYAIANQTGAGVGGYKSQPTRDSISFAAYDYWVVKLCDTTAGANILSEIQNAEFSISLFPNPATSELIVRSSEFREIERIEMYSSIGEKIFSQISTEASELNLQISIDVSQLPSGIYFITVTDEAENKAVKKLVKM